MKSPMNVLSQGYTRNGYLYTTTNKKDDYTLMMDAIFYLKCYYISTRPHDVISCKTVIFKVTVTRSLSLDIMMFLFTDKINSLALARGHVNAACDWILTDET